MEKYIVIPESIATANNGTLKVGCNVFNSVQTISGQWVTAYNSLFEFPALFDVETLDVVYLDITDFPEPEEEE